MDTGDFLRGLPLLAGMAALLIPGLVLGRAFQKFGPYRKQPDEPLDPRFVRLMIWFAVYVLWGTAVSWWAGQYLRSLGIEPGA